MGLFLALSGVIGAEANDVKNALSDFAQRKKICPGFFHVGIEDFIERNADPIWLHQNEMCEPMVTDPLEEE